MTINTIINRRKIIFLCIFFLKNFLFAGNITFGIGSNIQMHRTKITEHGLPIKEIKKKNLIAPSIFFATRFKDSRLEFSLDISYIRYRKTYVTNINFNNPTPIDAVSTTTEERVPFIMPKFNYQILKRKSFTLDVSAGFTYSFQFIGFTFNSSSKSYDSTINWNYIGDSPTYSRANVLLGLQGKLKLSKHFNLRLNIFNVFGGKTYIFRDQYVSTDLQGNSRKTEYGIYGGFLSADIKIAYTY